MGPTVAVAGNVAIRLSRPQADIEVPDYGKIFAANGPRFRNACEPTAVARNAG